MTSATQIATKERENVTNRSISNAAPTGAKDWNATTALFARLGLRSWLAMAACLGASAAVHAGALISNVTTNAARYVPGESVRIATDLHNATGANFQGTIEASVYHLGRLVTTIPGAATTLATDASATVPLTWTTPLLDYQGYEVVVIAKAKDGSETDRSTTAVDVSSDWTKFPRYGYVAHYESGLDANAVVKALNQFHLNGLQFYDWQWKHHVPYSGADSWPDIANRTISRAAVTQLIDAAHAYRMVAMNYNLYGGAVDGYTTDGSGATLAMTLFSHAKPAGGYSLADTTALAMPSGWATANLYEMNNRDAGWQQYIYGREKEVFAHFAFDGWHVDSVGTRSGYDYSGNAFSLLDYYPEFLNGAKTALGKRITFNTVDAGGETQVAQRANVDFVYSELWDNDPNYVNIGFRVENVRANTNKALVLAAYPDRGLTSGTFGEPGVRLLDAAIFASGAAHIELGDAANMLHNEYFPNADVTMSDSLRAAIRADYDFLVAYENILRDDTMTDSAAVSVTGATTSTAASAGAIWTIKKKNLGHSIVHFVNLANNTSTAWRDNNGTYKAPSVMTNLAVKMYYDGSIGDGKLWVASPDQDSGHATALNFQSGSDNTGTFVTFTLPRLEYWTAVWLDLNGSRSATAPLVAAHADTIAAASLEPTTNAGGGSDVGSVQNTAGGGYVGYSKVDFGGGVTSVSASVASSADNAKLELRLDYPNGPLIGTIAVPNTGGTQTWQTTTAAISSASGVHNLFVVFRNAASSLYSVQFVASRKPAITASPTDQTVAAGGTVTLAAAATGATSYQWTKDGAVVPGATDATLTIANASAANSGVYSLVATNDAGSTTSGSAIVYVGTSRPVSMINISTRSFVGGDYGNMIAGFVLRGNGPKRVLVRASGPALLPLGVTGVVDDPDLEIRDSSSRIAYNDNWGDNLDEKAAIAAAAESVGAFGWADNSRDAAAVLTLNPGVYTAIVSGKGGSGSALVEVYDLGPPSADCRLVNISTRSTVTASSPQIAGFVIHGVQPLPVLIRANGPSLGIFNLTGLLDDPTFDLYSGSSVIGGNDDWDASLADAFAALGAFPWTAGSKDAATSVSLSPGAYTAMVSGKNGSAGTALVEVYER